MTLSLSLSLSLCVCVCVCVRVCVCNLYMCVHTLCLDCWWQVQRPLPSPAQEAPATLDATAAQSPQLDK